MSEPTNRDDHDRPRRPFLRMAPHRWMLLLLAAGILWRLVRYGLCFPIWGDEAFIAVNFITRSFGELMGPLDHPQIVPVGFLWAQWLLSRLIGTGEYALRLLPALAGISALLVFWHLAPKLISRHQAMAAVMILAASYYPMRHSVEVKSYSLDLLIALALLWQAWGLCKSPRSVPRWVVFGLSSTAAVWFSYPIVFIIGGAMCVLAYRLWEDRAGGAWLAGWAAAGLIQSLSFLAMWELVAVGQETHHAGIHELRGWASAFPPLDSLTGFIAWFFRAHTGNMFAYPVGGNHGGSTVTFILFVFGIIALWRTGHRLALALLLSPMPLMFIAAALKKYPYGDSARVEQHFAPAVCLIAGAGLVAFLHHGWKMRGTITGLRITGIVLLCIIAYGIVRDFREPYKKESDLVALQTVQSLASQVQPGDQWVFFGSLGGSDQVPDLLPYGGSLARFRYDLLQHGPEGVPILWGPNPDEVPPPRPGHRTCVFFYRDNDAEKNPYPEELADKYQQALVHRLGRPAQIREYDLKEELERVEVWCFTATTLN